jgi:hypothetical protein
MPTDVIIEPSSGQIYWNDSGGIGASQSISIAGNAADQIRILGYGFIYTLGGSIGASTERVIFNDSLTSTIKPGANGSGLGDATFSWDLYAYNSYFRQNINLYGASEFRYYNATNAQYAAFKYTGASTATYTLPTGYPASIGSSFLSSGTDGVMAWVAVPISGSATTSLNVNVSGAATSNFEHRIIFTTASTSVAGAALSQNSTLSYNPSTDILSVSGILVTSGPSATNTTSGALQVRGGIGATGTSFFQTISVASLTGTGNAVINGNFEFKGNGTFGDNAQLDTINLNARFSDTIAPSANNTYDLGAVGLGATGPLMWKNIYAATGISAPNFTGFASTSQAINVFASTTNASHPILFTPATTSVTGAAVSSVSTVSVNPSNSTITATTFSGAFSGNVTGNVTGFAQTARNIDLVFTTAAGSHYVALSPQGTSVSGAATSAVTTVFVTPSTGTVSATTFSGAFSGNVTGNVTGFAQTARNLDLVFTTAAGNHFLTFSPQGTNVSGAAISSVTTVFVTPSTGTVSATTFSGALSGNVTGNVTGFAQTARNLDLVFTTAAGSHYITFSPQGTNVSGAAISSVTTVFVTPSTGTVTATTFSGAFSGNVTGNVTGTSTTSQNTTVVFSSTPATAHYLTFIPQSTSVAGAAVSAVTTIFATPSTGTINATTFSGAFSGTLSGYASTGRNVDVQLATTNAVHAVTFTPQLTAVVGSATSSDNMLVYNPSTKILTTSGLAVTALTETTSATTGAFLVTGSAGIAKSISVGTSVIFWNGANYSAFKSGATANQIYTLPIGYPGTGTSVLASDTAGTMTWVPSSGAGGGSGVVNSGVASKIAYYPTSTTTVDDATGMSYTEFSSGTAVTFQVFGGAATGNTIFTVSGIGQTLVRVGIGVSNPQYELEINGELSATNKSFVINHPTKPGMKLRYGSLEGPENGVYVRGELRNTNIIVVPDHWYGLVDEDTYTVHLTPIGTFAQLYVVNIEDYNVYIADNHMNPIHCYYSVWAERKDIPKLVTEY